ncbi:antA/AntB antirepressor family protein [Limibacter armeniacum]|uniref:antA/AntB antirepressor family protein n=1 Tax=Limibacter armeniacum TaxID=466084 RepID=UPI002FE539C2
MHQLITISQDHNGQQVVSARELHTKLRVGKRFTTWMELRIDKYGFIEGEDFEKLASQNGEASWGGHNKVDYAITLSMAKELCMVENNELGRQYRRYLIKMEKVALQQINTSLPNFNDPVAAARAWADQMEERKKVEQEVMVLMPKARAWERFCDHNGLLNTEQISKYFGFSSAIKMNRDLVDRKIIKRDPAGNNTWLLTARYSPASLGFEIARLTWGEHGGKDRGHLKWTKRGVQFLDSIYNGQKQLF